MASAEDTARAADDDRLRSEYVWQLIHESPASVAQVSTTQIPKTIVQFWHDLRDVPDDVRSCIGTWAPLENQGFIREFFDDKTAGQFIASEYGTAEARAFDRCPHPAMRCDYFRLCYIFRLGGFYVDADDVYLGGDVRQWFHDDRLKVQPLCYDIPSDSMVPMREFGTQPTCSGERVYYVNNNPIIAPRCHPVVGLALTRATRVLLSRSRQRFDIQFATGPGNLTRTLVQHCVSRGPHRTRRDFEFLTDWEALSRSQWPLGYRSDERNWRLWRPRE